MQVLEGGTPLPKGSRVHHAAQCGMRVESTADIQDSIVEDTKIQQIFVLPRGTATISGTMVRRRTGAA